MGPLFQTTFLRKPNVQKTPLPVETPISSLPSSLSKIKKTFKKKKPMIVLVAIREMSPSHKDMSDHGPWRICRERLNQAAAEGPGSPELLDLELHSHAPETFPDVNAEQICAQYIISLLNWGETNRRMGAIGWIHPLKQTNSFCCQGILGILPRRDWTDAAAEGKSELSLWDRPMFPDFSHPWVQNSITLHFPGQILISTFLTSVWWLTTKSGAWTMKLKGSQD